MNNEQPKKDYSQTISGWNRFREDGSQSISLSYKGEKVLLIPNKYKKEGSKQPDWVQWIPKDQKFNPYKEQLPHTAPQKRWEAPSVEEDVPDFKPTITDENCPF